MKSAFVVLGSALLLGPYCFIGCLCPGAGAGGGRGGFTEQGGEAIFKNVCQGCHMPDGEARWARACIRRWPRIRSGKWRAIRSR